MPDLVEKVTQINRHHVEYFAQFVTKLNSVQEGDGTLLDNCMLVYGSSLSDGNTHNHLDLPVVVVGNGGALKTGRHLKYLKC